jgi:hypothetical protein
MKTIPLAACVLALGLPALAQDAQPAEGDIDVDFSWSSVDLSSIPGPGGTSVVVSEAHLVLTGKAPLDKLAGRCLFKDVQAGESGKSLGACAFADSDGDMLFEDVTIEGGTGRGILTGGTGKLAGITGELAITLTWFSSIRAGENQGVGTKTGHWKRQAM